MTKNDFPHINDFSKRPGSVRHTDYNEIARILKAMRLRSAWHLLWAMLNDPTVAIVGRGYERA
jgi:hypothetical protein